MPNVYQTFSINTRLGFFPPCSRNDRSFRPITGNTHGMKLRINPASIAAPIINGNDDDAESFDCGIN
jgi:hypothetical protein